MVRATAQVDLITGHKNITGEENVKNTLKHTNYQKGTHSL